MKALEHLKELLEEEIKKVAKKGDITPAEVEAMYKVVDIIKDIDTIEAMEEYGEDDEEEYSNRGYSRRGYSSRRSYMDGGGSYRRGGRSSAYRGGGSYNRRSYRGYSMEESRDAMMSKLEEAMNEATTEHERQAIMACMDKI